MATNDYVDVIDVGGVSKPIQDTALKARVDLLEANPGNGNGQISQQVIGRITTNVDTVLNRLNLLIESLAPLAYKETPVDTFEPLTWFSEDTPTDPDLVPLLTSPQQGESIDVGFIQLGESFVSRPVAVVGENLTKVLNVQITQGTGFSVSPAALQADDVNNGATIVVEYSGEATSATGSLMIYSNEVSVQVGLVASRATVEDPTTYSVSVSGVGVYLENTSDILSGSRFESALKPTTGYTFKNYGIAPSISMGGEPLDISVGSGNSVVYDETNDRYNITIGSVTGDIVVSAGANKIHTVVYSTVGCSIYGSIPGMFTPSINSSSVVNGDNVMFFVGKSSGYSFDTINYGITDSQNIDALSSGAISNVQVTKNGAAGFAVITLYNVRDSLNVAVALSAESGQQQPELEGLCHSYEQQLDSTDHEAADLCGVMNLSNELPNLTSAYYGNGRTKTEYGGNNLLIGKDEQTGVVTEACDFSIVIKNYSPAYMTGQANNGQTWQTYQMLIYFTDASRDIATYAGYSSALGQFLIGIRPSTGYGYYCFPYLQYRKSGQSESVYFVPDNAPADFGIAATEKKTVVFTCLQEGSSSVVTAYIDGLVSDTIETEVPLVVRGISAKMRSGADVSFKFDNIELYNRELTQNEILSLMDEDLPDDLPET